MKVIIKKEKCELDNNDIKWYLCDGCLWITRYNEYEDIERSIEHTIGSFNWLYPINDTVLFQKESGKFETAVIDLTSIVSQKESECSFDFRAEIVKGNLYLQEMKNQDFVFREQVYYNERDDFLYAVPYNLKKERAYVLFIVDEFGFVIEEDELKGWILKNASSHVHIDGMEKKLCSDGCSLLGRYFKELYLWDENQDTVCLEKLLDGINERTDTVSVSIKECIESILSW